MTFAFAGDVHFESNLAGLLGSRPNTLLAGVQPLLKDADVSVVNLETAITDGAGAKAAKQFTFATRPAALDSLTSQGVDVIGMANNHGMDFGKAGLDQTLAAIKARNAPVIGIGANEADAYKPWTKTIKNQRIAVIAATDVLDANLVAAWTAGPNQGGLASAKRRDRLVQAVREARANADTLVVFLHWGTEGSTCPNAAQPELAKALIDAGADMVIGSHAHRVQGAGYLGKAYVAYGLGNFQFYSGSRGAGNPGNTSGVLTLTATGRQVSAPQWHPARIGGDNLPVLLSGAAADQAVSAWSALRGCANLAEKPR